MSKIKKILSDIEKLEGALRKEHKALAQKYGYLVKKRKVIFSSKFRLKNKLFKIPAWKYAIPRKIKHLFSLPFIYSMIIPAVILDAFITIYQTCAFPLYGIPRVQRKEYFVYDRRFLDYLNVIQKVHCLYCTYVNGLFAYAVEIGARTERYWCPIKAASKPKAFHGWYKEFADYGDPEEWSSKFNDQCAFQEIEKQK